MSKSSQPSNSSVRSLRSDVALRRIADCRCQRCFTSRSKCNRSNSRDRRVRGRCNARLGPVPVIVVNCHEGFWWIIVGIVRVPAHVLIVAVGGGVEWAFWDNWSAKVEYDFYDFSTRNLSLPGTISGIPDVVPGVNIKETISTVKIGINYRFGAYWELRLSDVSCAPAEVDPVSDATAPAARRCSQQCAAPRASS
jgi:hypothetical protein